MLKIMYGASLLSIMNEAGEAVLILTEGVQDSELLASRLTRAEVAKQAAILIESAIALPVEIQQAMPEIDWAGIGMAGSALSGPAGSVRDEALVFASRSLVPATLMWMRVYQQQHPEWFKLDTGPARTA